MRLVIDASVAVKWYVPEDYSDDAIYILKLVRDGRVELFAPTLMRTEFANAIRKYVVRGIVDEETAKDILEAVKLVPISYHETTWNLVHEAFHYALRRSITVYDAIYVVLAKKLSAKFVTADLKLHAALAKEPEVMFLGEIRLKLK